MWEMEHRKRKWYVWAVKEKQIVAHEYRHLAKGEPAHDKERENHESFQRGSRYTQAK